MTNNVDKFNETVSVLVKAYFDETLVHGNCYACAVGNIVAHGLGVGYVRTNPSYQKRLAWDDDSPYPANNITNTPGWGAAFCTDREYGSGKIKQSINKRVLEMDSVKRQISATGYHWKDLAKIEFAFESVRSNAKNRDFKGLMAVVDVLAEIHEIDLQQKESAKLMFVKP